ncbi:MAG TPA: LysM peptidoglycan-binding domain-containing protein, partial [Gemmatimonadaceae bacterium]|nr:LysM peptidoglycan-binding domain-containing protein [Gemmatimonadaceae bacterium]
VPDPSIERYGSATKPATRTHTVRAGESLSVIGRRYGTSVTQLKKANGLQSDRIKPGQRLVVPAQSTSDRGAD